MDEILQPDTPKLWTPTKKLTEREQAYAWELFKECWINAVREATQDFDAEAEYRNCVAAALMVSTVEKEGITT